MGSKRILWLVVFLLLSRSAQAFAGMSMLDVLSDEALLKDFPVIVATIEQVNDQDATNGNPPRVTLLVEKALQGDLKPGRHEARWLPGSHDIDYTGGDSTARLQAWASKPLRGPGVGAKMILMGSMGNMYGTRAPYSSGTDSFLVFTRCRYPYSEEKLARVLDIIEKGKVERKERNEAESREREKQKKAWEDKFIRWKEEINTDQIIRLTKKADLIAIGSSDGRSELNVLKGTKRMRYRDNKYFADVDLPKWLEDIPFYINKPEVLLFLSEHGMKRKNASWYYPILENGAVYASEQAIKVVKDTVLHEPAANTKPFCFVQTGGYLYKHSHHDNILFTDQLTDAFRAVGDGRCSVASGPFTADVLGLQLAIGAELMENPESEDVVFKLSGKVLRNNLLEVVIENEIWTIKRDISSMNAKVLHDKADDFLTRLLNYYKNGKTVDGIPRTALDGSSCENYIGYFDPSNNVFVATIEKVEGSGHTNQNPPKVVLSVSEVIKGDIELGRQEVLWAPSPRVVEQCGNDPQFNTAEVWQNTPLAAPAVGSKWIIAGSYEGEHEQLVFKSGCATIYSDNKRFLALHANAQGKSKFTLDVTKLALKADVVAVAEYRKWGVYGGVTILRVLKGDIPTFCGDWIEPKFTQEPLWSYRSQLWKNKDQKAILFFKESHIEKTMRGCAYPIVPGGFILSDQESMGIVEKEIASTQNNTQRQVCLVVVGNLFKGSSQALLMQQRYNTKLENIIASYKKDVLIIRGWGESWLDYHKLLRQIQDRRSDSRTDIEVNEPLTGLKFLVTVYLDEKTFNEGRPLVELRAFMPKDKSLGKEILFETIPFEHDEASMGDRIYKFMDKMTAKGAVQVSS